MIDIDRLIISLKPLINDNTLFILTKALSEQGLEFKNGKLQLIEPIYKYKQLINIDGSEKTWCIERVEYRDGYGTVYIIKDENNKYLDIPVSEQYKFHRVHRIPKFKIGDKIKHESDENFFSKKIIDINYQEEVYVLDNGVNLHFWSDHMWVSI